MQLDAALEAAALESLTKIGLTPAFLGQSNENFLLSAQQVNILVGMYGKIKGNIMLCCNKQLAFKIVALLTGDNDIKTFNENERKVLAEFSDNMCKRAIEMTEPSETVHRSPATVITGDRLFLHISKNSTAKLSFRIDDQYFYISFSLDL